MKAKLDKNYILKKATKEELEIIIDYIYIRKDILQTNNLSDTMFISENLNKLDSNIFE